MFIVEDEFERTPWHMAAEKDQIELLHKLWEWAKVVLTQEELNNMLLTKDRDGKNRLAHGSVAGPNRGVKRTVGVG